MPLENTFTFDIIKEIYDTKKTNIAGKSPPITIIYTKLQHPINLNQISPIIRFFGRRNNHATAI